MYGIEVTICDDVEHIQPFTSFEKDWFDAIKNAISVIEKKKMERQAKRKKKKIRK